MCLKLPQLALSSDLSVPPSPTHVPSTIPTGLSSEILSLPLLNLVPYLNSLSAPISRSLPLRPHLPTTTPPLLTSLSPSLSSTTYPYPNPPSPLPLTVPLPHLLSLSSELPSFSSLLQCPSPPSQSQLWLSLSPPSLSSPPEPEATARPSCRSCFRRRNPPPPPRYRYHPRRPLHSAPRHPRRLRPRLGRCRSQSPVDNACVVVTAVVGVVVFMHQSRCDPSCIRILFPYMCLHMFVAFMSSCFKNRSEPLCISCPLLSFPWLLFKAKARTWNFLGISW